MRLKPGLFFVGGVDPFLEQGANVVIMGNAEFEETLLRCFFWSLVSVSSLLGFMEEEVRIEAGLVSVWSLADLSWGYGLEFFFGKDVG